MGNKALQGIGASAGIAAGRAFVVEKTAVEIPELDKPLERLRESAAAVSAELTRLASEAESHDRGEAAEILNAQALMADDPMLIDQVGELLDGGTALDEALGEAATTIAGILEASGVEYLAARAADIHEVADRVARHLAGVESKDLGDITEPVVIVAQNLTVADTSRLDPATALGFVTEEGGRTGHVAIIARSLGLPAVVGTAGLMEHATSIDALAIDGASGEVVLDPTADQQEEFDERARHHARQMEAVRAYRGKSVSYAGQHLAIAANVGSPGDLESAVESGADGVGLFRSEFLFASRTQPPSEDEQFEAYAAAVRAFDDPVIIRTLDVGADKQLPYLESPVEENPFLGIRGTRLYEQHPALFQTQARALLRAATEGDLWVMLPMVATREDIHAARAQVDQARRTLKAEGVPHGDFRLGIMIEVPAAALMADQLAGEADFFSIGTNDLTQYVMAADRGLGSLSKYHDAAHPAVLRICQSVIGAARAHSRPVGVCGEAAADPVLAVLFAAMGVTELSVAPTSVNTIKATIDTLDSGLAATLLASSLDAGDADEVRNHVASALSGNNSS